MEITIDLPDRTLRKVKALHALAGNIPDVEEYLAKQLDAVLTMEIQKHLYGDEAIQTIHVPSVFKSDPVHDPSSTTISNTLSYDDIEDDELEDEDNLGELDDELEIQKPAPKKKAKKTSKETAQTVTAETLQNDSKVEDPEHEAISGDGDPTDFESLLGVNSSLLEGGAGEEDLTGMFDPPPISRESKPPRPGKKPLPKDVAKRVKVKGMEHGEQSSAGDGY